MTVKNWDGFKLMPAFDAKPVLPAPGLGVADK
jgi:hypothetical protein